MKRIALALILALSLSPVAHAQTLTPAQVTAVKAAVKTAQDALAKATKILTPPVVISGGVTTVVPATGNAQTALDAAHCGDTIKLTAGATYTGNFKLRAKGCTPTNRITLTTTATLPSGRITPASAALLPKLNPTPGGLPDLATEANADSYALVGLQFMPAFYDMLDLGDGSSAQNSLTQVPTDLLVDRCLFIGDPVDGQKRAISLNSASTTIRDSYFADIKKQGQDSQAIGGWNGPGSYVITNNYVEAAGENIMFGGGDPAIVGLVPSDITITGNYVTKNLAWRTQGYVAKNLLELKNAQRVLIDGNLFENSYCCSQDGFGIMFTVRNQDGTAPWSTVQHVKFTHNVVRHTAAGLSLLAVDDSASKPSGRMTDIVITDDLFYDVDPGEWRNLSTGQWGSGRLIQIVDGPLGLELGRLTIVYSSPNAPSTLNTFITIGTGLGKYKIEQLNIHDVIAAEGDYGIHGDNTGIGVAAFDVFVASYQWSAVTLIRGQYSGGGYHYAAGTRVNAEGEIVVNPDFTPAAGFSGGVDIAALRLAIPGLDLTK